MSTDKSIYAPGEIITLTVIGDSEGAIDIGVFGTVNYDRNRVSPLGGQTQTALRTGAGFRWIRGGLLVDIPFVGTQYSFSQINGLTVPQGSTKKLTAVMTFRATNAGSANFDWCVGCAAQSLDFFGLTAADGITVSIAAIPEPSTAGLMGLGLLGLAGLRRLRG
jgi:hypothetical protein